MNNWYVYRHLRLDKNEPFYIGIGCKKDFQRAYETSDEKRNAIWIKIFNKNQIEVEILFENLTKEEASIKEQEFIKIYGRIDLKTGTLCNMTDGGDGILNYQHTNETKELLRKLKTGTKLTQKHIEILKQSNTGRKHAHEELCKMSISQLGEKNHMWGKNGTSVSNSKLSSESVIWIRTNFIKGDLSFGYRAIAKKYNVSKTTIMDVIKGKLWKNP